MNLPKSSTLPVELLAAVFNNTTNSYKFYWFLALLENLKKNSNEDILIEDIIIEMIGSVWYPINFFRLSFGKQDKFTHTIKEIKREYNYYIDIDRSELLLELKAHRNDITIQNLTMILSRYVPYRFLSPWFDNQLRGVSDSKKNNVIAELSLKRFNNEIEPPLYCFSDDGRIKINTKWRSYLLQHIGLLHGFIYWHLTNYLQKNNPNVPNISSKLFPPEARELTTAKKFWKIYFIARKSCMCIYSGQTLKGDNFSIDHFIPWGFVGHDLLWNLLPIPQSINSSKSDNLPNEKYVKMFANIQYDAFQIASRSDANTEKLLEDYIMLFKCGISEIIQFDQEKFSHILIDNIKPLMQIAANMGFQKDWIYNNS